MGFMIEDGKGSGRNAGVDSFNRVLAQSVASTFGDDETRRGRGYNFNTNLVTMTTANESGLAYILNNGNTNVIVETTVFATGTSTGGTGSGVIRYYRNPTGGTLISSGVSRPPVNRNFASSRVLTGSYLAGDGTALTVTGGSLLLVSVLEGAARAPIDIGYFQLQPGNSFAVTWQPPAANTSQQMIFAARLHEEDF